MARSGDIPADDDAPLSPGEARIEALLDERLAPEQRRAFAREVDAHDRAPRASGPDMARLRRTLRFQGQVPERVRNLLGDWVPELVRYAGERGLALRDPYQELRVYTREAFEAEQGGLPGGIRLPASSFQHNALYRRYTVRLVLPERLESTEAVLTAVRALLNRLYGEVFLREEVFPLEAYREDVEGAEADVSVGLAEQIAILAELPHTTAELETALGTYARNVGINYKKHPEQARKAWCREATQELALQRLPPERQRLLEHTFASYLDALRQDVSTGVAALVEAVEAQDRQLHFLPPDQAPHHARLRDQNPLHYLRAVKLRLEFLLEAFAGLIEDFEALDGPGAGHAALAEERVAGCIAELERGNLARPYLVPGVQLSEELERKRKGFPLEVHGLLAEFPPEEQSERGYRTLRKRLESSLYQRLYNALVLLRHWMRLRDSGRAESFPQSEAYRTLKGLAANFRFRRPLLEALFLRIGVVLDVAEHQPEAPGAEAGRTRLPPDALSRTWGQFAAHALLAEYLAHERRLKGFDAARYWERVETRLRGQVGDGQTGAQAVYLLRRVQAAAGEAEGLPVVADELRRCSSTFRFALAQALRPRPEAKPPMEWLDQLDAWAQSVLRAREASLRNAIVIGEAGE